MNKVIINKEYFSLASPKANDLITGLKKLHLKDFIIEAPGYSNQNETLKKILYLEGIIINEKNEDLDNIFEIESSLPSTSIALGLLSSIPM